MKTIRHNSVFRCTEILDAAGHRLLTDSQASSRAKAEKEALARKRERTALAYKRRFAKATGGGL